MVEYKMIYLFFLIHTIKITLQDSGEKTLLLIELFRHGARNPYIQGEFLTIPKQDFGDLTLVGMRQHYLLGKAIRKKYSEFLPKEYDFKNIEIISSNRNRTLVSAASQIAGLFDLGTGQKINYDKPEYYNPPIQDFDIPYPPEYKDDALPHAPTFIPIQNADKNRNTFFTANHECPVLKKKLDNLKDQLNKKYKDVFQSLYTNLINHNYLPQMYGKQDEYDIPLAVTVCDIIVSRQYSDPEFTEDEVLIDQCLYILDIQEFIIFSDENTRKTLQTEFSQTVLNYINNKALGKIEDLKMLLLSGHDVNQIIFLMSLFPDNLNCALQEYIEKYNKKQVVKEQCFIKKFGFASNIIFELFEKEGLFYVRAILDNDSFKIFGNEEKTDVTSLPEFNKLLHKNIDPNYITNCGNEWIVPAETSGKGYFVAWLITLLILLALVVYYFSLKQKLQEKELSDSLQEEKFIL